ncbi:MAG: hypothetical protein ACKVS8_04155 [Phycisphaerales bacterium]
MRAHTNRSVCSHRSPHRLNGVTAPATVLAFCAGLAAAVPAWFDNGADQHGFFPGVPDLYQHQKYEAALTSAWESRYPSTTFTQLAEVAGVCRQTSLVGALARLEARGFKGVTEAKINDGGGDWRDAANTAIETIAGTASVQGYLDARRATDDGKLWKAALKLNQFRADSASGEISIDGKVYKEGPKGSETPVNAFTIYKRLLVNEQGPMVVFKRDPAKTYSDTVWWGNFHSMGGTGVSEKNGKFRMFLTDPDSNKGNRSAKATYKIGSSVPGTPADAGHAGWVFHLTDRAKNDFLEKHTIVDGKTGAAADITKKLTVVLALAGDGSATVRFFNGADATDTGRITVRKKGDDDNINARKYGGGDADPPLVKTGNGAGDPAAGVLADRVARLDFDTSTLKKAITVAASDDNEGDVTDKGRFTNVLIDFIETISKSPVLDQVAAPRPAPLRAAPGATGVHTPLTFVSPLTTAVDAIQVVPVTSSAVFDATLDGATLTDSLGGMWLTSFIPGAGETDPWGNPLPAAGGAWHFERVSGSGLPAFDAAAAGDPATLDTLVATTGSLLHYQVFVHAESTIEGGNPFGGYWLMYPYGATEVELQQQTEHLIDTESVPSLPDHCLLDYNIDGVVNPDDLGDFITDYFTFPHLAGPGGYAIACPENAPPFDMGYQAGFTFDGSGTCIEPNPDNLGDFITAYFLVQVIGCDAL